MSDKSISDYIECEEHDWHDLVACPFCELEAKDKRIAELESALQRIREGAPTIGEDVSFAIAKAALKGQDEYITLSKRDFDKLVDKITTKSE